MERKNRAPFWVFLVFAFVVLQLLDGLLTGIGVSLYGLGLEANPIAAFSFTKLGVWQGVLVAKTMSFVVFFALLWYCLKVRWSLLDVIGLLWKREPKRDKAYALACFYVAGVITILASLYAGGGWIFLLVWLGLVS